MRASHAKAPSLMQAKAASGARLAPMRYGRPAAKDVKAAMKAIRYAVEVATWDAIAGEAWRAVWDATWYAVEIATWDAVSDATVDAVNNATNDAAKDAKRG